MKRRDSPQGSGASDIRQFFNNALAARLAAGRQGPTPR
jgi:hypothetical protein